MNLLKKHRSGEPITLEDKLSTVTSRAELEGFQDQMRRDGRLTTEALIAIERRRKEIG